MKSLTAVPSLLLLLILCTLPLAGYSQLADQADEEEPILRPLEITVGYGLGSLFQRPSVNSSFNPAGMVIGIGYRPPAFSERAVFGLYGFNLPGIDAFEPQPTIRGIGIRAGYRLLRQTALLNPYVSLEGGWYEVDVPVAPMDAADGEYSPLNTASLAPGVGFYISVTPAVSLKAGTRIHIPLSGGAVESKSDDPRMITSFGVSLWLPNLF